MALTTQQKRNAWRWMLERDPAIGNTFTKTALDAGATATDDWIDLNQGTTTSGPGYNSALPASPGFRAATSTQKTLLFCAVALVRAGVI